MIGRSVLNQVQTKSPLAQTVALNPNARSLKKTLAAAVTLTSLVDAFTILVIYLLVNSQSTPNEMNVGKNITLPMASQAIAIENGAVLRIENDNYYLNDKKIQISDLSKELVRLQNEMSGDTKDERPKLIIQADRKTDFSVISPIIQASSEIGFYIIKFAVLSEGAI